MKYGTTPFAVPSIFPEFLFPKGNNNPNLRTSMDNTLDNVFTRDNRQNF